MAARQDESLDLLVQALLSLQPGAEWACFQEPGAKNPRSDVKKRSDLVFFTSIFSDQIHRTASSALGFYRDDFG